MKRVIIFLILMTVSLATVAAKTLQQRKKQIANSIAPVRCYLKFDDMWNDTCITRSQRFYALGTHALFANPCQRAFLRILVNEPVCYRCHRGTLKITAIKAKNNE